MYNHIIISLNRTIENLDKIINKKNISNQDIAKIENDFFYVKKEIESIKERIFTLYKQERDHRKDLKQFNQDLKHTIYLFNIMTFHLHKNIILYSENFYKDKFKYSFIVDTYIIKILNSLTIWEGSNDDNENFNEFYQYIKFKILDIKDGLFKIDPIMIYKRALKISEVDFKYMDYGSYFYLILPAFELLYNYSFSYKNKTKELTYG